MGYTVIRQYGDITEIREYEKNLPHKRKRAKKRKPTQKTKRSLTRTRDNFFELVYHNLIENKDPPTFITLTYAEDVQHEQSIKDLKHFNEKIKKHYGKQISYIIVPEYTKKGRKHYHALFWGLPYNDIQSERDTRFLQRLWQRGYIDVLTAHNKSERIAGYLTKYFSKASKDKKLQGKRLYNASRNILKTRKIGSHWVSSILQEFYDEPLIVSNSQYETTWLGTCVKRTYKKLSTGNIAKQQTIM